MRLVSQSLFIILSFAIAYLWQNSPLANYTIPALGFLIFLYLITFARKSQKNQRQLGGTLDILILNTVILLLIFSTGGLNSTLFFLLYFLGFGISFVFEPKTVFIFVLSAIAVFYPEIFQNDLMGNIIKLGSLALISPLAYFFGKEYKKRDVQKEAVEAITKDVSKVIENQKQNLKQEDVQNLSDVLEKTEKLRNER
ncbi:MAG: hypothetical protein Q7S38_00250 [bacterium]|nr:hypothetical protein [bacterium]